MNRLFIRLLFLASVALALSLSLLSLNAQQAADGTTIAAFATNTPLPQNAAAATTPQAPAQPEPQSDTQPVSAALAEDEPVQLTLPDVCEYTGDPTSQGCIAFMEANPAPQVEQIGLDTATLSQYDFWRIGPDPVPTFDAPNGNITGEIPQGFNFVTAVQRIDGWIQDEQGRWLRQSDGYHVPPSYFAGVTLPQDWQLPFGYILDLTGIYASTVPGGDPTQESGLLPLRYEIYNIYAEAEDDEGWTWYLVGPDQWVKQIFMSVILPTQRPDGVTGRWVAVDLYEQSLVAYEDDTPVYATLISSGLPEYSTNEGLFEVWATLASDPMSGATGAPNAYALQRVPWVQYFDGGISLHGTYWHDWFGYRRSRGCVNLSISDARWVFDFFQNDPNAGDDNPNYVYVHSTGEYRRG